MRERRVEAEGVTTWVRESPGDGVPVIFFHGNPTDANDWLLFQARLGQRSFAPDLPGFGRSGAPDPSEFDYSVEAYGRWAEALIGALGLDRYALVIHDWGSVGLLPALREPDRVECLVIFNAVPFGLGYRWHRTARIWRRRGPGEILNALARGPAIDLALREARPRFKAMPRDFTERVRRNLDRPECRQAILRLYRSAPESKLEELGVDLHRLKAPTLLLWGQDDPYIKPEYGRRWAERAPNASLEEVEAAGHWPWLDRPELIERAVQFLASPR